MKTEGISKKALRLSVVALAAFIVIVAICWIAIANISGKGNHDTGGLQVYDGKYPTESGFFDDADIAARLKKILGQRCAIIRDSMRVETPISIADSVLSVSGCWQHNCSSSNYIIVLDLTENVLYAGIRLDDQVQTYSENGSTHPYIELWQQ